MCAFRDPLRRERSRSHRRFREADFESDNDSSSGNEYAEGLGCADRKRCREKASSGFEFDNHPREEYFQEPKSHAFALASDGSDDGSDDSGDDGGLGENARRAGGGLLSTLKLLEDEEEAEAAAKAQEAAKAALERRLEAKRRRCEHRDTRRSERGDGRGVARLRSQATPAKAPEGLSRKPVQKSADRSLSVPELTEIAGKLRQLRTGETSGPSCSGSGSGSSSSAPVSSSAASSALSLLQQLARLPSMPAKTLKATGLGRELNENGWKRHPQANISKLARTLVSRWRESYRAEQAAQQQHEVSSLLSAASKSMARC